jgi:phospholipase C
VPAIVISPLIPRNLIDHRVYDHASIPATLETCFGLGSMTRRDAGASNLMALVSLSSPRSNAPTALPAPATSGVGGCAPLVYSGAGMPEELITALPVTRPQDSANTGNVPGLLHSALRFDLALSAPEYRASVISKVGSIRTRAEAMQYINQVRQKMRSARALSPSP